MAEGVPLTPEEAAWLVMHLMEILEGIYEGKPVRGSWAGDTWLFVAVLMNRMGLDGPPEPGGGWADPNMN